MDIGSLLYFGAITVWSGAVAYFVLEKFFPKKEAAPAVEAAPEAFPAPTPPRYVPDEQPKAPVPDYQMAEGFKAFQTGTELTVEDIVKGLSRRGERSQP